MADEPAGITVARLELANRRILDCAPSNIAELESAMAARDEAVRAVAALDPGEFGEAVAERLRRACDDGRRIREKLAEIYRGTHAELRKLDRLDEARPRNCVSVVG